MSVFGRITTMRAWIGEQLKDPTQVLHGVGVLAIIVELVYHWVTKHPVDMSGVIPVAFGCIAGGILQDRINTPPK